MARKQKNPATPGRLVAGRPVSAQTTTSQVARTGTGSGTALILGVVSLVMFFAGFVFVGFYVYSFPGQHLRFLGTGFLTACAAFVLGCLVGLVVGIPRFVSSGAMRHDMEARRVAARTVAVQATAARPTAAAVAVAVAPTGAEEGMTEAGVAEAADITAPLPQDQPEQAPSNQLTFSTNLAEISDWLTKLLLGAGLVELTRLGKPLSTLVNAVARAIQDIPASAKPTQTSLVVASGLLAMYVVLGFLDGYVLTNVWYAKYLEQLD
jgi:hypothetical protein